jgi:hypothetical protein
MNFKVGDIVEVLPEKNDRGFQGIGVVKKLYPRNRCSVYFDIPVEFVGTDFYQWDMSCDNLILSELNQSPLIKALL